MYSAKLLIDDAITNSVIPMATSNADNMKNR